MGSGKKLIKRQNSEAARIQTNTCGRKHGLKGRQRELQEGAALIGLEQHQKIQQQLWGNVWADARAS
jgi:hypothetical protein